VLTLIWAAIKKDVDVQLGIIFDYQAANRKQVSATALVEASLLT
jgi:hypothetical protein